MESFIEKQLQLIEIERSYDVEETRRTTKMYEAVTLQKKVRCPGQEGGPVVIHPPMVRPPGKLFRLINDSVLDVESGTSGVALPSNRFRTGDVVSLTPYAAKKPGKQDKDDTPTDAVVHRISDFKVTLVLNKEDDLPPDVETTRFRLDRLADEVSYERMTSSLLSLKKQLDRPSDVMRVLFGKRDPSFEDESTAAATIFQNDSLNEPQKEAIQFAIRAREAAAIHGPPGTGKTTAIAEVIHQLLKKNLRLLVCAPSNVAVDNLMERVETKQRTLRLGHPSRMLPSAFSSSLDYQIKNSDAGVLVTELRQEIDAIFSKITSKKTTKSERRELYQEMKALRSDLRSRERELITGLVRDARAIFCTLCGAGSKKLVNEQFDVVLIDEVSQSLEAECWIAIQKSPKVILAGDPFQLPPTVKCSKAAKGGLEQTLFDRLKVLHGDKVVRLLTIQYRMNEKIMGWANEAMYDGRLVAFPAIQHHTLVDLPRIQVTDETNQVLVLIDTAGCDMNETSDQDSESKWNEGEAKLCMTYVRLLAAAGIPPSEIAIISPYNAQVQQLRNLRADSYPGMEIGSVDGFQGREKEVILLSLVRSNDKGEVGFLSEERRLNVAVTRAKRHVCLICDTDTIRRDKFMNKMVDYFEEHGDIRYPYTVE